MSTHIESNINDIAKTVLMPGDPKRCEYIAKKFLSNAKIINNVRGMTAYTGYYKSKQITVFPSGMGIPSMGIYSYELFKEYNVENIIRIGTMGSYTNLQLKDIVLVENSITNSNYGRYLCNYQNININSNAELNSKIELSAQELNLKINKGNIYSSDVFYEQNNNFQEKVAKYSVLGVEMESFALLLNAKLLNKKATTLLMVSDSFIFADKLSSLEREQGLDNLIILALEASLKI
ncbi:MAG: purine-nucleoside phosphorylase [Bacilli bacterium]|jgi:purine-nucleoside phosphorylase|nr:purine-nucleoside phosphorylase [Bacilli bacterium]MDY5996839.1 purine-nucleoside phosphorylase [Bacilli bacterium]MEE1371210.1 purine-nucleoside phosphorylase [Bacilli bacterium]